MGPRRREVAAVLAATCLACAGERELARVGDVRVLEAFAPQPLTPEAGSLYFTIVNDGDADDRVVAAEVDVADSAHFHAQIAVGGGMMRMEPRTALDLPAGDTLRLGPGGLHTMLTGSLSPYRQGDSIRVTLSLDGAGSVAFWAPVVSYAEAAARSGDGGTS